MLRRTLLIMAAALAILVASGAALLTGNQLAQTINWVLPKGWQVDIPEKLVAHWHEVSLPHFALHYQGCPLIKADGFRLSWQDPAHISLDHAVWDYHCVTTLPRHETPDEPESPLPTLLAWLPDGKVEIGALRAVNLPDDLSPRLRPLLTTATALRLEKHADTLTANVSQQGDHAVHFSAKMANRHASGELRYQPAQQEDHQLHFSGQLADEPLSLPPELSLTYRWQLTAEQIADPALQQGQAVLHWQQHAEQYHGELTLSSTHSPENQLQLPFRFDQQSLFIEQARFDWQLSKALPLRGFLTTQITPKRWQLGELFPIKTALRISLLTQNDKGKGNVVISSPEGEWQADQLNLPLQITGNVKQGNYILYSSLPLDLQGHYHDLTLRFLPSALLRVTGKERLLTIHDLRFPLAGIRVDKHGITGRLHAIFRGESPDFKQIELHLDGFAQHFKAGALAFFQDPPDRKVIKDRWQWRLWGKSHFNPLNTPLTLSGRGVWQKKQIEITDLTSDLGAIRQTGVRLSPSRLRLAEPIKYAYENNHLVGGVQLDIAHIQFDYGGELEKLSARLNVAGELENLHLKGDVRAGKLGPIRLFARRQLSEKSSDLIGRLYWSEQPANVFQPLFPFRSHWVVTHGTIRGETAFSANARKGLIAGGHFAIRNGALSLPNGEIKGITFSLPYQFKQNAFDIGVKQALDVQIAEINLGVPLRNAKLKVKGHYPYSKKRPLFLRELRVDLLGGRLDVERFALPQTQIAYLKLSSIRFDQILALAQYHQLDLQGAADAVLPFWLSGKPCYICQGTLTQTAPSTLRFSPELLTAMKKSGYTEQILTYLVNESVIDQLQAELNLATNGEMQLATQLKMHLAAHQRAKIHLNYRHQENMFDLWQLINAGSQVEQQIEHSIYQQLDNR